MSFPFQCKTKISQTLRISSHQSPQFGQQIVWEKNFETIQRVSKVPQPSSWPSVCFSCGPFQSQPFKHIGHIKTNRDSQISTVLVLLDVEKAFDSVWHKSSLHKLVTSNCYLYLTKIIVFFLNGRSFHFCVHKTSSATHSIPYGVRQGATLSPFLYNFANSIHRKVLWLFLYLFRTIED
jgi:hypothetical protein